MKEQREDSAWAWVVRSVMTAVIFLAAWEAKGAVDEMSNGLDGLFKVAPYVFVMAACMFIMMATTSKKTTNKRG